MNSYRYVRGMLLILFAVAGRESMGQYRIKADYSVFKSPYSKLTLQDGGFVHLQPVNMLYGYRDGALYEDEARPQIDFKVETDIMLAKVEGNIEKRLKKLDEKKQELNSLLAKGFPGANAAAFQLQQHTLNRNSNLQSLATQQARILTELQQLSLQKYLDNLNAIKSISNKHADKALYKQQLAKNALRDLEKLQASLLEETNWHRSDGSLAGGLLAANLLATSNLIYDLLGMNPALKGRLGIKTFAAIKSHLQDMLIAGEVDPEKVADLFFDAATMDAGDDGSDLETIAEAMIGLAETVKLMTELPEEQKNLKEVVKEQLLKIQIGIREYSEREMTNRRVWELHRYMIESIDNYLRLNNVFVPYEPPPAPYVPPPAEHIRPRGFDFKGFEYRNDTYQGIIPLKADVEYEKRKMEAAWKVALTRFNNSIAGGKPDPVFATAEALAADRRKSALCIRYAAAFAERAPAMVINWLEAAREIRYTALQYHRFEEKPLRYSTVNTDSITYKVTEAALYTMQQHSAGKESLIFSLRLAALVYAAPVTALQNNLQQWPKAEELVVHAARDSVFLYLGAATDQHTLDSAAYLATAGTPVWAIGIKQNGENEVALLLPGANAGKQAWCANWSRWMPYAAGYAIACENFEINNATMDKVFKLCKPEEIFLYYAR